MISFGNSEERIHSYFFFHLFEVIRALPWGFFLHHQSISALIITSPSPPGLPIFLEEPLRWLYWINTEAVKIFFVHSFSISLPSFVFLHSPHHHLLIVYLSHQNVSTTKLVTLIFHNYILKICHDGLVHCR